MIEFQFLPVVKLAVVTMVMVVMLMKVTCAQTMWHTIFNAGINLHTQNTHTKSAPTTLKTVSMQDISNKAQKRNSL